MVEKVLDNMVNSNTLSVSTYISPAYLSAHAVKVGDYQINTYSPTGYSIEENKGNGVIVARIWGSNRSWVHELTFIVTYENSAYYFMPGREPSSYFYIDPWYIVKTDVKDDNGGSSKPSTTESRSLVTDIVYDMVNNQDDFGTRARKYIAPSYYRKNNIDKEVYQINFYSPKGGEIKSVGDDGMVEAYIWGADKSWVHLLTFKVVKENGKAYLYPKGHTDNDYIHPWFELTTDVTYNKSTNGVKNEKTELVDKICNAMVSSKDDFGTAMRLYIAPSYYKSNNLDPFTYQVNSYTPKGYSVGTIDSRGYVKAKIWGADRAWVHELTFKVVEEFGLIYVMPGKHYDGTEYVDPWYSVETNVEE